MRLIDADRLNEVIKRNFARPSGFMQLVNAQPTAYDVDRVVEQLEEREKIQFSSFSKPLITVEDAIRIAKGGADDA